jgi:hypothetical protein
MGRVAMVDRRTFVALFATSAGTSLLTDFSSAQIQPGTLKIAPATIREAARLAGLTWTDAECEEVADALSSFAAHAGQIDKDALVNASPLPIHFDPRPPGVAISLPQSLFRASSAPRAQRPPNLEDTAFWSIPALAQLIRSRQVTATELTKMYLARLQRHDPALNCG